FDVQKYGVVLRVERSRHLQSTQQTVQPKQNVAIKLPNYRFEPGYYIAIGDCGPVVEPATEIYFAAAATAVPTLLETLTRALNGTDDDREEGTSTFSPHVSPFLFSGRALKMPYTLRVPYEPEAFEGPEAIALRIETAALPLIKPLLKYLREQHTAQEIRLETPLFGEALWPGIAVADVIESDSTEWFGSSAELSRVELVAEALTEKLLTERLLTEKVLTADAVAPMSSDQFSADSAATMLRIKAKLAEAGLCWEQPSRRLDIAQSSSRRAS
ncbi:MAG: T3SS effector HopA1 family protein, partial [Cyanobacteria bacterium P01_D01_bin.105]